MNQRPSFRNRLEQALVPYATIRVEPVDTTAHVVELLLHHAEIDLWMQPPTSANSR